jgi:cytochrome c-type biogenesis protein CcmH/NrfG
MALIILGDAEFSVEDEQRFQLVSREFEAEARLHQDDAANQSQLGLVLLMSGEYDRAADALVNSLGLEPNRPTTKFLLALARLGEHREGEARALFRQVPRSDPYYNTAQERLRELERPPK